MRTFVVRLSVALAALAPLAAAAAFAAPASAAEVGSICSTDTASIKLSPGIEETVPKVQNVVVKGVLSGCTGGTVSEGKYVAHLKTAGPMTCATVASGEAASGTIVIKWAPKGQGNSHGSVEMTIGGAGTTIFGSIAAGPFTGDGIYSPVSTSYGSCGNAKAKLKLGSLSGSTARIAAPPHATIEAPAGHGVYTLGQVVPTTFSCTEGLFGPGLESCTDSNGATGGAGALNTSELGEHTYSVVARSIDGLKGRDGISYEVVE
jgi:hypothetical protein